MQNPKKKVLTVIILISVLGLISYVYALEVHKEYDWWEPSLLLEEAPKEWTNCMACHETTAGGGMHPGNRKICEDCHLLGRGGAFVYYSFGDLYRNFNYSAPIIYNHIINASSPRISYIYSAELIEVEDQSDRFNGDTRSSCFGWNPETGEGTCHGISSDNPIDGYYAFNLTKEPTREDPYRYTVESAHLPDTVDCLYCHRQDSQEIIVAWGGATQINSSHFESNEREQCYECHVEGNIELVSFHIMGPEPEVVFLEPPEETPPPPTLPPTISPTTPPPATQPPTTEAPPVVPKTTQPPLNLSPETTQPPLTNPPPQTGFYNRIFESVIKFLENLWCTITQSC